MEIGKGEARGAGYHVDQASRGVGEQGNRVGRLAHVYASPNRVPVVSRERCNFHYLTTEK
jgi:hypothetical protein